MGGGRPLPGAEGGRAGTAVLAGPGLRASPQGPPLWAAVLRRWVPAAARGGGAGGARVSRGTASPGRGGAQPRCSPAPRLLRKHLGRKAGCCPLGPARRVPFLSGDGEGGRTGRGFRLGFWAPGSWWWRDAQEEGRAGGGAPGLVSPWGLLREASEASEASEQGVHQWASHPDPSSFTSCQTSDLSFHDHKRGDVPQRNMGSSRGHWAEGQPPLDSSGVRQVCRSASVGASGLARSTRGPGPPGGVVSV